MTIGEYIKDKRKQFKLTQIELAERSGVGVRFVRELERGKTTVQLDKVNQVLELFGETLYPRRINEKGKNLHKRCVLWCIGRKFRRVFLPIRH